MFHSYPTLVTFFAFLIRPQPSIAGLGILPASDYWQVSPPLNYSDVLYAGWSQIPIKKEIIVYSGTEIGRTYAHHPQLLAVGTTVYLIYSSAPIDEDSMGMELWGSVPHDSGYTWTPSHSALLPNQTNTANFSYWCNEAIWQRAIGGLAVLDVDGEIWAVGQTTDWFCWGGIGSGTRGAGRIARQVSSVDGGTIGNPCWLEQNDWTEVTLYNETVYGTEYGMAICDTALAMNTLLAKPDMVPAWSDWLYNNELYAGNSTTSFQEVTHAIYIEDESGNWYPVVEEAYGNKIFETNIPDAKTKQFLRALNEGTDRFLLSNPRNNTELIRQPLTMAISRGSDLSYRNVGVLRTNASDEIVPDTRDYKNQGFSYPVGVQVGNLLVTAYSENKQNIWVSVVNIDNLPGA